MFYFIRNFSNYDQRLAKNLATKIISLTNSEVIHSLNSSKASKQRMHQSKTPYSHIV